MMIKFCKAISIFLLFFALGAQSSFAQRHAASDLTYTCVGGNTYLITYTFYQDCEGVHPNNKIQIQFNCSSNSSYSFYAFISKVPGTGQEITPKCPSTPSSCGSGTGYGIKEYVYQGQVILAPCNYWTMTAYSCCRNIVSTTGITSNSYSLTAKLNNLTAPCNSSPVFSSKPIDIVCKNQNYCFSCGTSEPDGDALVYSFTTPIAYNSPVTYIAPYSAANFINSSTPITMNSNTGDICFTPNSAMTTITGIKVKEYRTINGVSTFIGEVNRDLEIKTIQCNNEVPIISGIDTSLSGNYSPDDTIYYITKCMDEDSISFNIYGYDADTFNVIKQGSPEKFSISLKSPIPGALFKTYNNGTDSAFAYFSWMPSKSDLNKTRCFSAKIRDKACPYNASNSFTYCLLVKGFKVDIGHDTLICMGEDIKLKAKAEYGTVNYIWNMDGLPIGNPTSQDSLIISSSNIGIGTHKVKIETNKGGLATACPGVDYLTLKVAYLPHIHGTIRDSAICNNKALTIDAGPGNQYIWKGANGNVLWRKRKFTTNIGGPYILIVDGDSNSRCRDTDSFRIFSLSAPLPFYLGKDTTIKPSQTLTLSMPKGMPSYIWSTGATTRSITIDNSFNWINKIVGSIFLPNNCYASDTIYVFIGNVGMEEKDDLPINIFPNPMHQSLTIELDKAYKDSKLEIYDINGKQVFSKHFSGQKLKIDSMDQLKNGLYFVWLKNIELNVVLRVVKK